MSALALARSSAVVVGAGVAGLATALKLAPMPVTVLSATPLGDGTASAWAQGGVAAAFGADDAPALHAADTLAVAGGIGDPAIAALVAEAAPACIEWLVRLGARFDRDAAGAYRLGREGGHGRNRIVHAAGDGTGAEIMRALVVAARACPSITLLEGVQADMLLQVDGTVTGLLARRGGELLIVPADALVLATGGVGSLYCHTSNPPGARGRGLALAARAGAQLADLEFVQFHPTGLAVGRDPMPLVTEAIRGEGAILLDAAGERFMPALHPLAELAPRDIVARAVWQRLRRGAVFLDARAALGATFPQRFPTVYAACRAAGIDPVQAPMPIAPAAHYHMGGIAVDARGRSSLDGLWAVGEVACTGLHGANRLASNSLLEALVFADRVAADIRGGTPSVGRLPRLVPRPAGKADDAALFARVRQAISDGVGVERDAAGLRRALAELRRVRALAEPVSAPVADAALVGELIAEAALARRESRGAHQRADFPATAAVGRRGTSTTFLQEVAS
jgi:L-aspartate oxidase